MTNSVDYDFWEPWTVNNVIEVSIDGVKLHEVLRMIKSQMEILRRQQNKFMEFGSVGEMVAKMELLTARVNELEANAQKNQGSEMLLKHLEEKNEKHYSSTNDRLEKMQRTLEVAEAKHSNGVSKDLMEKKLKDYSQFNDDKLNELKEVMDFYINNHSNTHNDLTQYIEGHLESSLTQVQHGLADLGSKVNPIADVLSVHDLRLKSSESKIDLVSQSLEYLKKVVGDIPEHYLKVIHQKLETLEESKALKTDVESKVDASSLNLKVDIVEFEKMSDFSNELERRIGFQYRELNDGLKSINKALESKSEKIARWCLQQVIKGLSRQDSGADGTDIGRVRCLVCNQNVPQNTETELSSSHLPLKVSLRPHKAAPPLPGNSLTPRSNSNSPRNSAMHPKMTTTNSAKNIEKSTDGLPTNRPYSSSPYKNSQSNGQLFYTEINEDIDVNPILLIAQDHVGYFVEENQQTHGEYSPAVLAVVGKNAIKNPSYEVYGEISRPTTVPSRSSLRPRKKITGSTESPARKSSLS